MGLAPAISNLHRARHRKSEPRADSTEPTEHRSRAHNSDHKNPRPCGENDTIFVKDYNFNDDIHFFFRAGHLPIVVKLQDWIASFLCRVSVSFTSARRCHRGVNCLQATRCGKTIAWAGVKSKLTHKNVSASIRV